jgi:hypothetical protein
MIEREGLHAGLRKRAGHETMPVVLIGELDVSAGGEFGFARSGGGDVLGGVGEDLGVARGRERPTAYTESPVCRLRR